MKIDAASQDFHMLCTSKKLHSVEFRCEENSMIVYVDDIKKFVEILNGIRNSDKPTRFLKTAGIINGFGGVRE